MSLIAGQFVTETLACDGGRQITAYVPPTPPEATDSGATGSAPEAALTEEMFHGFQGATVAAGPQTWEVVSAGAQLNELLLMQLAPGITFDQVQAMSMAPPFTEHGGVTPMNPGCTNNFEVDQVSGEYAVICFVPDPDTGVPHLAPGMAAGITVA